MKRISTFLLLLFFATGLRAQFNQAQIIGVDSIYCHFGPGDPLLGLPQGGTFSGPGMDGDVFYPMGAGVGTFAIKYSVMQNGSMLTATAWVTVTDTIYGQILGPNGFFSSVCTGAEPMLLTTDMPYPMSFYGPGVTEMQGGYYLDPSQLDPNGTYTIYAYGGTPEGCAAKAELTFTVGSGATDAQIIGLPPGPICTNSEPFWLYGIPGGGNFFMQTSTGMIPLWADSTGGLMIVPQNYQPGVYTFVYQGNANDCYSVSGQVTIMNGGFATIAAPQQVCIPSPPVQLVATPPGGTFSGPGVQDNMFYPEMVGPGAYTISYSGGEGPCPYTATTTIWVNPGIMATAQSVPASCPTCNDGWAYVMIQGGNPPFYITLSNGQNYYFSQPADSILGLLPGVYTANIYADSSGCSGSVTFTIGSQTAGCGAPEGLTVTNIQAGSVLVQWNPVPSAATYTLRYRKVGSSAWLSLTVQGTYRSLTNLIPTAMYEWMVRANCINVGAGPFTNGASFMPDGGVAPCARPTGLTVTAMSWHSAMVSWNAQPGVMSYEVQYRRTAGGPWLTFTVQEPHAMLNELMGATLYSVRVRAICNGNYETPWSLIVNFQTPTAPCMAPANFNVIQVGAESATLKWNPVPGAATFIVEFSANGGVWTPVTVSQGTMVTLNGLTPGACYQVRIQTHCLNDDASEWVYQQFCTTDISPGCPAPTMLMAEQVTANSAMLHWNPMQFAIGYMLDIIDGTLNVPVLSTQSTGTMFVVPGLVGGHLYIAQVRSMCSDSLNPVSPEPIVTTFVTPDGKNAQSVSQTANETFTLYPNPNKGNFTLRFVSTEESNVKVALIDATGREVYTQQTQAQKGENEVYVETNLARGLYLLRAGNYTGRIVIE